MDKREIREVCIRFSSIFVLVNRDEGMVNQGNTFTTWLPCCFDKLLKYFSVTPFSRGLLEE